MQKIIITIFINLLLISLSSFAAPASTTNTTPLSIDQCAALEGKLMKHKPSAARIREVREACEKALKKSPPKSYTRECLIKAANCIHNCQKKGNTPTACAQTCTETNEKCPAK